MIWSLAFRFVVGLKSQLPGSKKRVGSGNELVYHILKQLVLFIFYPVEVAMVLIGGKQNRRVSDPTLISKMKWIASGLTLKIILGFVLLEVKFS